jgi:glutathione S-transferase
MSLTLYYHPLASFCHKVLIALYENGTPFEPHLVDLGDPDASAAFKRLWPMGKMPVLQDHARGEVVGETSIVIEYLDQHYPGVTKLIPADPDLARQARFWDRFYDLYVSEPMQKIVGDKLRPAGANDPFGVEVAQTSLQTACGVIEREMAERTWAVGDAFTMADCAAAPGLFYADQLIPFDETHPSLTRYFDRLVDRPSFARVIEEARPYFHLFPGRPGGVSHRPAMDRGGAR